MRRSVLPTRGRTTAALVLAALAGLSLSGCVSVRAGTSGSMAPEDFRSPGAAPDRTVATRPAPAEQPDPRPVRRAAPDPATPRGPDAGQPGSSQVGSSQAGSSQAGSSRASGVETRAPAAARTTSPEEAREGITDAHARTGEPRGLSEPSRVMERAVLIDSKVGDLNGDPIYASEILGVVGDRLRAEAQRRDRNDWRRLAREVLRQELRRRLESSVLEAEARNALPPEARRTGLLAVVQRMQADTLAQNFGSREIANQRVREQGYRDVDEFIDSRLRNDLISLHFSRVIGRRVAVSFQEIQRAYEIRYDEFNPRPVAVFHQIEVPTSDESAIAEVSARLEEGETFIDVARSRVNMRNPDTGGQTRFEFARHVEWREQRVFNVEELNRVAIGLEPGSWYGPFEVGSTTRWLYLDRVERTSRSLYEVQDQLRRSIENAKQEIEFDRYTRTLLSDATYTDLDEMTERLLEIAAARYLPIEGR